VEACPKFAESQRLDPAVGTLLNLAECQEHIGRIASAWEHWRTSLDQLPPSDSRVAIAKEHILALEPRLPHVTFVLAVGAPEGTHVLRDKVDLRRASFGVALPIDPGNHTFTFEAPGHEPAKRTERIVEGQSLTVEVEPGPVEAQPSAPAPVPPPAPALLAAPSPPPKPSSSGLRTAGYVVGSVGVAGFVAAAVTGALVLHEKSEANTDCLVTCNSAAPGDVSTGRTMLAVNAVMWGVGIAGVGAGAAMILLGGKHADSSAPSVTGAILPGAFVIRGSFQ